MNGLNVKAFRDFGLFTRDLQKAIDQDDVRKQALALTQMIESLKEAQRTMMEKQGGYLN